MRTSIKHLPSHKGLLPEFEFEEGWVVPKNYWITIYEGEVFIETICAECGYSINIPVDMQYI